MMRSAALARYLDAAFGIDLRSLALFRIGLAAVIAVDLLRRLTLDLVAFHTAWGVLPGADLLVTDSLWRINLLLVNDQAWWPALLITTALISALCLLLGYRTRLAVILLFVLMGSIHNRNPLVLIGGDLLIMALLFWAMFLPLSARCSIDAARALQPPPVSPLHRSWASAGLLVQVMSVYFFSAALKNGADWWPDGLAVYYTMELERYATPLARAILVERPWLMQGLSYFVYFLEWIGPVLVFLPFWSRGLRFLVMLLLMGMHVGFLLCLEIGHFPYVSLVSLSSFLGGWVWDALSRTSAGARGQRLGARLREGLRQHLARRPIRFGPGLRSAGPAPVAGVESGHPRGAAARQGRGGAAAGVSPAARRPDLGHVRPPSLPRRWLDGLPRRAGGRPRGRCAATGSAAGLVQAGADVLA
jgi:hypothetical protein